MGMYKTCYTAEESLNVDTKWLKEHGYFCGWKNGGISWTRGWSGDKSSIGLTVDTMEDSPNIKFRYSTKSWEDDEDRQMDYSFPLVKVPCNLGGFRWAFECGLYRNGFYCGNRVYTLFKANSDYFGCRKCMRIVYESQRKSGGRFSSFGRILDIGTEIEELYGKIHKWHYQGRPTKKVMKLQRLEEQLPSLNDKIEMFESLLS